MDNEKIVIGIIDDGVNTGLYEIGILVKDMEITKGLFVQPRSKIHPMMLSHGTTCAAVISEYAPDAPLCSIKITNSDTGRGIKNQLIKAIEWCSDNGIRLLNLSLGSTVYRDFADITKAVNDAARKGIIIVAAGDNRNIITCPASLSNVIGVSCDRRSMVGGGRYIYNYYAFLGIDITACGSHILTRATGEKRVLSPSNSFAAPFITARVYNIMKEFPEFTLEDIRKKLIEGAANTDYLLNPHLCRSIDWAEKALVFELGHGDSDIRLQDRNFKILTWQTIECQSLHEATSKMTDFFLQNRMIMEADIIVIINNISGKQYGWDTNEFLSNIGRLGKGIIYIAEEQEGIEDPENIKTKLLRTSAFYKFYRNTRKGSHVQMPVILLCDYTGELLTDILYEMDTAFKEDGYHSIAAVNLPLGLEALAQAHDPDIILLGITAANRRHEMPEIIKSAKADIVIEIVRGIGSDKGKIGEDIYFQVSVMERQEYRKKKIFFYTEGVPIGDIYNYITYLFKEYGDD